MRAVTVLAWLNICISASKAQLPAPSQAGLEKLLGGPEVIQIVQNSQHVEAVLVKVDEKNPDNKGWMPWHVIKTGKAFDLRPEDAKKVKSTLTDPSVYVDGEDACIFDPGIELNFHTANHAALTLLVCLHCNDVCVILDGKQIGYASFARGYPAVESLMQSIFPGDKDIRAIIDERQANIDKEKKDTAGWLAGMPKSIQPLWNRVMMDTAPIPSKGLVDPLRAALAKEFPDSSKRILALLTWYGSGAGPWSGYPAYEDVANEMLFDYPTADLLATISANTLNGHQLEGAARFFGGWDFSQRRPKDLKTLPASLKQTLLKHSLQSTDTDKIERAKSAFGR